MQDSLQKNLYTSFVFVHLQNDYVYNQVYNGKCTNQVALHYFGGAEGEACCVTTVGD